jgi:hypothetical protein
VLLQNQAAGEAREIAEDFWERSRPVWIRDN